MLLKVRYKRTTTYEAFVEVPSGLSREETFEHAMRESDKDDLWREVDSDESELEIVAEYGLLPTVRQDAPTAQGKDYPPEFNRST